jgi:hypothetical protein
MKPNSFEKLLKQAYLDMHPLEQWHFLQWALSNLKVTADRAEEIEASETKPIEKPSAGQKIMDRIRGT